MLTEQSEPEALAERETMAKQVQAATKPTDILIDDESADDVLAAMVAYYGERRQRYAGQVQSAAAQLVQSRNHTIEYLTEAVERLEAAAAREQWYRDLDASRKHERGETDD